MFFAVSTLGASAETTGPSCFRPASAAPSAALALSAPSLTPPATPPLPTAATHATTSALPHERSLLPNSPRADQTATPSLPATRHGEPGSHEAFSQPRLDDVAQIAGDERNDAYAVTGDEGEERARDAAAHQRIDPELGQPQRLLYGQVARQGFPCLAVDTSRLGIHHVNLSGDVEDRGDACVPGRKRYSHPAVSGGLPYRVERVTAGRRKSMNRATRRRGGEKAIIYCVAWKSDGG
jgi:hypothetical protein